MKYCCEMMKDNLNNKCDQHKSRYDCPDALLSQFKDGRIGIIVHDGGSSHITIKFCPWCGANLEVACKKKKKSAEIPKEDNTLKLYKVYFKNIGCYAKSGQLPHDYEVFAGYSLKDVEYWAEHEEMGNRSDDELAGKIELITSREDIHEDFMLTYPMPAFLKRTDLLGDNEFDVMDMAVEDFLDMIEKRKL